MTWKRKQSAAENARRVLPELAARYIERGNEIASTRPTYQRLHQFRLTTKRFRYTLELFQSVYGAEFDQYLAALRNVQQVLGDINDCDTILSMKAAARNVQFVSWLRIRREETRANFQTVWRENLGAEDASRRWVEYLEKS